MINQFEHTNIIIFLGIEVSINSLLSREACSAAVPPLHCPRCHTRA